jgi:hypothetical protein
LKRTSGDSSTKSAVNPVGDQLAGTMAVDLSEPDPPEDEPDGPDDDGGPLDGDELPLELSELPELDSLLDGEPDEPLDPLDDPLDESKLDPDDESLDELPQRTVNVGPGSIFVPGG